MTRTTIRSLLLLLIMTFATSVEARIDSKVFCRSGNEASCPAHDFFIPCGESLSNRVKEFCPTGTSSTTLTNDQPGGRCGVSTYRATCEVEDKLEFQVSIATKTIYSFVVVGLLGLSAFSLIAVFALRTTAKSK